MRHASPTWALLLALSRGVARGAANRRWERYAVTSLTGGTLLIIGLGGFGMLGDVQVIPPAIARFVRSQREMRNATEDIDEAVRNLNTSFLQQELRYKLQTQTLIRSTHRSQLSRPRWQGSKMSQKGWGESSQAQ